MMKLLSLFLSKKIITIVEMDRKETIVQTNGLGGGKGPGAGPTFQHDAFTQTSASIRGTIKVS